MEIIPAIDLKAGRCVRLYQGNFSQEIVFSEDPMAVALEWQSQGASRLHIVDLDGAAQGELVNKELIGDIARSVNIPVQVGGGIRKLATMEELMGVGIKWVVLGTVAVEEIRMLTEACRKFGEAIIVSLDARDGYVATHGWRRLTPIAALELARRLKDVGVRRLVYTDIRRDGTLTQPNFDAIAELVAEMSLPVIAAGGISSLAHVEKLKNLGVEGVIIGKALYTGDVKLRDALAIGKGK